MLLVWTLLEPAERRKIKSKEKGDTNCWTSVTSDAVRNTRKETKYDNVMLILCTELKTVAHTHITRIQNAQQQEKY